MKGLYKYGTGALAATGTAIIIAAPGAGVRLHICRAIISVAVASATSIITLTDGTTNLYVSQSGQYFYNFLCDWGEKGYPLAVNAALSLVMSIANSTVTVSAIGYAR